MRKAGIYLIVGQILIFIISLLAGGLNYDLTNSIDILKMVIFYSLGIIGFILLIIDFIKKSKETKARVQIILLALIAAISLVTVIYYTIKSSQIYVVCTNETFKESITTTSVYKIYSKSNEVQKIIIEENLSTYSIKNLDNIISSVTSVYDGFHDTIGSYTYKIKKEGNKAFVRLTIDYNKIDIKKYIENNPDAQKELNANNKYNTTDMIKKYEQIGAVCK